MEAVLYASSNPGNYALGSPYHPDITSGQAVELLLGGHWIPGHIADSSYQTEPSTTPASHTSNQNIGEYTIPLDEDNDRVTEASEESFPASDPPSWAASSPGTEQNIAHTVTGYYFIADADNSVCGLCSGMRLRIK